MKRFECPTCFRSDTSISVHDITDEGYRIERWKCKNPECPPFVVGSAVVYDADGELANFYKLAGNYRQISREYKQRKFGFRPRNSLAALDSIKISIKYKNGSCVKRSNRTCYAGHVYDQETCYISPDGKKHCRVCRRQRQSEYSDRRKQKR